MTPNERIDQLAHASPLRYHIEIACTKRLRNLLIIGLMIHLSWAGFLGVAAAQSIRQQSDRQVDQNRIGQIEVQAATTAEQVRALAARVEDTNRKVESIQGLLLQLLVAVMGLLVTAVLGMVGVLWNIRSGWLKVKPE